MAYMNQEKKAAIKAEVDKVLKGTGIKYSMGVRNHSTIVLNISKGPIDFIGNYSETIDEKLTEGKVRTYLDVNSYHVDNQFTGKALELVKGCITAMNLNNHDRSDIMTDYFDVGHYVDINIGKWNKPYELTEKK